MKRLTLLSLSLCLGIAALTQEKMPVVWEQKIDSKTDFAGLSDRGNYSYGADDKSITVLDNTAGTVKWSARYRDIVPKLRKIDELIPLWDANAIFVFERKTLGSDIMVCIDVETGQALWTSEKYSKVEEENLIFIPEMEAFALSLRDGLVMIRARTGEEIWNTSLFKGSIGNYIYTDDGHLVMINYKPTALGALFAGFKNQLVKINVANGDVVWDRNYFGRVMRKAVTREPIVDLSLQAGKVFLQLNGLQVYDYTTGAEVWKATFQEVQHPIKAPKGARRFGVYGAVADPLVVGNDVYVVDMKSKKSQYIRKYNLNTGELIWSSPEIKDAKTLPGLYVEGDRVIVQIGGIVEAQAFIVTRTRNSDGSYTERKEWRVWYPNIKPYGLLAFDANSGKLAWESERFKKGITNAFVDNGTLYVGSGTTLYAIDPYSGDDKYTSNIKSSKIGMASSILNSEGKVLVVGVNGIACFNKSDGKFINAGIYKKTQFGGTTGNAVKMDGAKGNFAVYTSENCKFRMYKPRKGAQSMLSNDGKYVYVYQKKAIAKLAAQ